MARQTRSGDGDDRGRAFGAALRWWRERRDLSLRELAPVLLTDYSTLSKIERGLQGVTYEQVTRAERALKTGGRLVDAHRRDLAIPRPRELLPAPAMLIGRDRHIAELDAILEARSAQSPPLVIIDGPAGAGKTALALRWAHQAASEFPDGQLYADLKGASPDGDAADPSKIICGFLQSLGVVDVPEDLDGRAAIFRSVTSGARLLILLDNAAGIDQVKPLLPSSPGCGVVVTSRRVLSGLTVAHDARRVSVAPLCESDAVDLVTAIVGENRAAADPPAVATLVRLCGRLPLALRIAAELAVIHPNRSLTALARDLADDDDRLDQLETDDPRSPRAVFEWTYRDLPEEAARVYRHLGLHRGPHLTASAIGALADLPRREVKSALKHLATVHMLDNLSYGAPSNLAQLHDLLHVYARDLLFTTESSAERTAAAQRLVVWYLHAVRAAGDVLDPRSAASHQLPPAPDDLDLPQFTTANDALDWCDQEAVNFVPISRLAAEHGPPGAAWRFGVALWDYLAIRRPWDIWRDTHQIGIAAARKEGDEHGEARITGHLAEALRQQGNVDEAKEHFNRALHLLRQQDEHRVHVWILIGAAILALTQHEHQRAHTLARRAIELFTAAGDVAGLAITQAITATTLAADGHTAAAVAHLSLAQDQLAFVDNATALRRVLPVLAQAYLASGDHVAALAMIDRAIQAHHQGHDSLGAAALEVQAGDLRHHLRHPDGPLVHWQRAHEIYATVDDSRALDLKEKIRQFKTLSSHQES